MKKKVVIIGAGPAGLTAAYDILSRSDEYEVVVLEADKQVGGISKTVKHNGNRMDLGGHRFFTKDRRVLEFWKEILPVQGKNSFDDALLNRSKKLEENGPDPEKSDEVFLLRHRVSRIYYLKKFFDYPISLSVQTIKNLGFVRMLQSGFSYLKSCFVKKKEDSLENFYINRFGKKLYSMFFESYTEKLWGRHPSQISPDWGAQRVKGLSVMAVLKDCLCKIFHIKNKDKETSLIEEFMYPKYGPGHLWETVAEKVKSMGGKILFNASVKNIKIQNSKISSITYLYEGKEMVLNGDVFISSMAIKDLIVGMNDVPERVVSLAQGLPYRDFVTVGLLLKKLNLKNETKIRTLNNIIPDCWIYVQEKNVSLGRIQVFNNWSPYMVKHPMDTIWIGLEYFAQEGDSFWKLSNKQLRDFGLKELRAMGIIDEDVKALDYHVEKIRKAYPAYFDTYESFDEVRDYLNSFDNLYCIGRNGQHRYNNMDHSVSTAFAAVDVILSGNKDKSSIWNVNTEKEYHEEVS